MGHQPPSVVQSESELERLLDLSLDLLSIAGFDGYFKRVNPAVERTLGYSSQEVLTRAFWDFIQSDDLEASRAVFADLLRGTT